MSRALSATAKAAIFAQETGECPLFLVEFDHTDWGSPIRIVNNTEDVVSGGNTYTAFPFELELPESAPDREARTTIRVCNVDRQIVALLDALATPPTATLSLVLASTPNTIELGPADFELVDYQYGTLVLEGTLAYEDVLNERIPADIFSPGDYPGLF